ncbi:unnamed protein product [Echinostoma caproni]|uniref:Gag-pol polyprotein n=1 Tax=Echinostoma caproni TaxID=27848 RepID=A0A183AKZ1_9TREM|nr:unnamed protein product [Echinostoma caproni]
MKSGTYESGEKTNLGEADFREVEPWQTPIVVKSSNIPTPEKFVMGDDFQVWESQVRRYIKRVPINMR